MSRSYHSVIGGAAKNPVGRFKTAWGAADREPMTMELSPRYAEVLEVPAARLGRFLAAARTREGIALADIARRLDWKFTPVVLSMIERGVYPVLTEDIPELVDGYRVDLDQLLPDRDGLQVDLEGGTLGSGENLVQLSERLTITELLRSYLSFVREIRGLRSDATLPRRSLRRDDMEILARTLRLDVGEIEHRLTAILDPAAADARKAIENGGRGRPDAEPEEEPEPDPRRSLHARRQDDRRGLRERFAEAVETREPNPFPGEYSHLPPPPPPPRSG